jgi:hypothetical protein
MTDSHEQRKVSAASARNTRLPIFSARRLLAKPSVGITMIETTVTAIPTAAFKSILCLRFDLGSTMEGDYASRFEWVKPASRVQRCTDTPASLSSLLRYEGDADVLHLAVW